VQARPQWQGLREAPSPTVSSKANSKAETRSHEALQQLYTQVGGGGKGATKPASAPSSKPASGRREGRKGAENTPPGLSLPEATAAAVRAAEDQLRMFALQEALASRPHRQQQQQAES